MNVTDEKELANFVQVIRQYCSVNPAWAEVRDGLDRFCKETGRTRGFATLYLLTLGLSMANEIEKEFKEHAASFLAKKFGTKGE